LGEAKLEMNNKKNSTQQRNYCIWIDDTFGVLIAFGQLLRQENVSNFQTQQKTQNDKNKTKITN